MGAIKVHKERRLVIVLVGNYRLEGEMHVLPGARISDELNKTNQFLPLTNVSIFSLDDSKLIDTVPLVLVNKDMISLLVPIEK